MVARKRARRKSEGGTKPGSRGGSFRALAEGLYELRVGRRVVIDVLVTLDGELLTFVRVDGVLLAELQVLGQA